MDGRNLLVVRFDVDTSVCIKHGVPRLIKLAKKKDVRFSFFVNMGRAVCRRMLMVNGLHAKTTPPKAAKLSNRYKLGTLGYLKTALCNPLVGKTSRAILRTLEGEGHEIGLHGGQNHAKWQNYANQWHEHRLRSELIWGKKAFAEAGMAHPVGFASPGWNSPPALRSLLEQEGFDLIADRHGRQAGCVSKSGGLWEVMTNLLGEPGGIGYLEYLRAQFEDDNVMLTHFANDLQACGSLAVLYDHPAYVGRHELDTLERMIDIARADGREIVTMRQAVKHLD